ncbi:hypothetical protein DFH28DRAFT_1186869 [Melampsora americana]|nr:hypothetical protein DFH28DRAFT_1186869 [Melampsora americana]
MTTDLRLERMEFQSLNTQSKNIPKSKPDKPDEDSSKSPNWTHATSQCLINALILQKLAGKKSATGFKKVAWTVVTNEFNDTFKFNFKKTQLKNHFQMTKGQYSNVHGLRNTSGAGWDNDTQMTQRGTAAYKTKSFLLHDLMNKLCGEVNATVNGIIGTQTATPPLIDQVINPPADNSVANDPSADDSVGNNQSAEERPANNPVVNNQSAKECPANNQSAKERPANNQFDLSDGLKDEIDNGFCLPPPLKRRGLDEPHPHSDTGLPSKTSLAYLLPLS